MNWPFVSRARHLEQVADLRVLVAELRAQLVAAEQRVEIAETDAERFRRYYERLADDTLMKRGDASGPVHHVVEPKPSMTDTIGRAFALVGNASGAPITGPRHAATHADATRQR